jgi:hypothetical protein
MWGQADGEDGSRHRHSSKNNRDLNGQSNRKKEERSICQKAQSNNDMTSNEWAALLRLIINTVVDTLHAFVWNWAMNTQIIYTRFLSIFFCLRWRLLFNRESLSFHFISPFAHLLYIAYCCVCSLLDVLIRFWWLYVDHRHMGVSMWSRQPIRRPRPNLMKLSGFVENFSLIILVILFFEFDHVFIGIWAKYCFHILVFFEFFLQKKFATISKNWWFVIIIRSNH